MRRNDTEGFYYSLDTLTGRKVVFADLVDELRALRRSDILLWIAALSEIVSRDDGLTMARQLALLPDLLPSDEWAKAKAFLATDTERNGCFFHRRQLWFVLQVALLVSREDTQELDEDTFRPKFGLACMMANDLLKQTELTQQPNADDNEDSLTYLITFLVSCLDLSYGHEIFARAEYLWFTIPNDQQIKAKAKSLGLETSLDELFRAKYGMSLRDFVLVLLVMYAKFNESSIREMPSPLFLDMKVFTERTFTESEIAIVTSLVSTTPEELALRLLGKPRQSWAFDFTPLLKTPLLKVEGEEYVCPDLHLFRAYFVQGIYELLLAACPTVDFKQFFGDLFEKYIARVIESFAIANTQLVNNFFRKVHFVSGNKEEACDGLFQWSSLAVLMEYKASMLTTRQRYAMSEDDTIRGIEDMLAKRGKNAKGIGQLEKTLTRIVKGDAIRSGALSVELSTSRKLYPALVVYDEFLGNHAVREHLHNKLVAWLTEKGVDRSRIGHLLLFTIRDIEYFGQLAESIGAEQLMKDYAEHIEANRYDRNSMFHMYAQLKYTAKQRKGGFVEQEVKKVLDSAAAEAKKRQAKADEV